MSTKHIFMAMLGATALLALLFVGGAYKSQQMFAVEGQKLSDLHLEQGVLNKQSASLAQAKKDISSNEELELIARSVVPQDKDQAKTVLELVNIAAQSGIEVTAVTFPDSLLGQIASGKKTKATTDSNLTQLTALDNPKGVYSMEIKLETNRDRLISYQQLITFLQRLEKNRRTAQVTDISITPDAENRNQLTFSLSLTSYVKPLVSK